MTSELNRIIEQVGKEKGIDKQILVEALEAAMLTVSIKKFGANMEIEARYNEELGEVELFQFKIVVEQVRNPSLEISLPEAKLVDPEVEFGDSLGMKMDTRSLGRIAAQTAKQVIMQRMREAEREITYGEYVDRTGEMVSGIVLRAEHGNIIIDLGRAEAVLLLKEQIPVETWKRGDRIRAILIDVTKSTKLPQLVVSRVDPRFLTALFDLEVPEIREGIVKIVVAVREPGYRAKVSVASSERNVDPVGACVGVKGSRVQAVVHELRGEKIDIIPWSEDIGRFVVSALSPAQITKVIMDDEYKSMEVIVPNDQLSLAIGKKGQNVRLAANLTKWKIDIRGEEAVESPPELAPGQMAEELLALPGVGDKLAQALAEAGYSDVARLAQANPEELAQIPGIGSKKAEQLARVAKEQLGSN